MPVTDHLAGVGLSPNFSIRALIEIFATGAPNITQDLDQTNAENSDGRPNNNRIRVEVSDHQIHMTHSVLGHPESYHSAQAG